VVTFSEQVCWEYGTGATIWIFVKEVTNRGTLKQKVIPQDLLKHVCTSIQQGFALSSTGILCHMVDNEYLEK